MEFTKDKDFFSTCRNREWACKITLQPIERFDLDAAIIFSDILVIPQVLGMEVLMMPKEGPVFTSPLKSVSQWREIQCSLLQANGVSDSLADKDSALLDLCPQLVNTSLSYVYQAITLTRHRLEGRVPLIGFAGSPWTVFVYMTEGRASRLFSQCRKWLFTEPTVSHTILLMLAHMTAHYLIGQAEAGAQLLQVFDSHGGVMSPKLWRTFSLPYLVMIAEMVKQRFPDIPMICFAKDVYYGLPDLKSTLYDIVALDPSMNLGQSHEEMSRHQKGVQGNFDPTALYAPKERLAELTKEMLHEAFGDGSSLPTRYICNLGHGMNPDHDPEHLKVFIDTVHAFGKS